MELQTAVNEIVEHILIHYRWVFVCFFLLPLSVLYDVYFNIRSWIVFQLNSAPKAHDRKVSSVQAQVKQWKAEGSTKQMCTARPGWQTICFRVAKYKDTLFNVNINMVDIVNIDIQRQTIFVEPLVTMGQLTARLEPLGWTIPVLPELDDLTVGGLVMGTGIETSSHKYGLFQHICVRMELVLSNGEKVTCSKDENPDLFYAVPWSYGSLGFLTGVEIKIIPANRFVKVEYFPAHTLDRAVALFDEYSKKENDNQFVEGIMFNKDKGVIMVGNMTTSAEPGKLNKIGLWYKPWFFKHVESFLRVGPAVEYIPLRHYYHRHSRSIFWEIQEIIPFGNHPVFRYLLGWMVPPKVSLLKLTQPEAVKKLYEERHVIQDMLIPLNTLKESILTFDRLIKIYPLWLCPFKLESNPGMVHPAGEKEELYVDIGAYGIPTVPHYQAENTTRELEAFVRKNNGFQMLYADTYMTKPEFRKMFDHKLYDEIRQKYQCKLAFPEVYDKVSLKARR